jgi:hypothetical protein
MARFQFTCLYGHDRDIEVPAALVDNHYGPGARWMLQGIGQNLLYLSPTRGDHPCVECERKLIAMIEARNFQRIWGPQPGVCSFCGGPTPCLRQD